MAKFVLASDVNIIVRGVFTTLKAGEYETKDEEVIELLKNVKQANEVKQRKAKAAE